MGLMIRRAIQDDWPAMREVFRAAGRAAWAHILHEATLDQLTPPDRWRRAIDDPEQRVLVAEAAGRLVGFAVVSPAEDAGACELDSFYVHPDDWGKGLGRR